MSGSNERNANGAERRKLKARVRSYGLPCAICGMRIDYSLPAGHPWCYELDEKIPVSRWAEFGYPSKNAAALDPNNVQPSHRWCNVRKGNKLLTKAQQASLAKRAREAYSAYFSTATQNDRLEASADW